MAGIKQLLRTAYAIGRNRIGIPTPVFLQLKPTYRCGMGCAFCNLREAKTEELSTEHWLSVIRQGYTLGAAVVNFSGGEPLCRNDIKELVSGAHKLGYVTMMNTNGTGLADAASALSLDHVSVSLDFPDAQEHGRFRKRQGAFTEAVRGIRAANHAGIATRLNCVVSRLNMGKLGRMAVLAQRLGVNITYVPVLTDFAPAGRSVSESNPDVRKISIGAEKYTEIVRALKKRYRHVATPGFFLDAVESQRFACRATYTVINVQPDGRATLPCEVRALASYSCLSMENGYRSRKTARYALLNKRFSFCRNCMSQCSITPSLLMNPVNLASMYLGWDTKLGNKR